MIAFAAPGLVELAVIAVIGLILIGVPLLLVFGILYGTKSGPFSGRDNPRLRACPDCRKQVSRQASACPHCGCPLDSDSAD